MKVGPALFKISGHKDKVKQRKVIGITGTHRGAGVTHLGVLAAVYIRKILGRPVAFAEYGSRGVFAEIARACEVSVKEESFVMWGISFYLQVDSQRLTEILNENYEYIVVDFGNGFQYNNEYMRCDLKFVVSSLREWKQHYLIEFLQKSKEVKGYEQWIYFITFGQEKEIAWVRRTLGIALRPVPYVPCPFKETDKTIDLFRGIL